jgi:site-specific recombinase XerD
MIWLFREGGAFNMARTRGPAFSEVERMWRENGCLTEHTIEVYRSFVQRFLEYCRNGGLRPRRELTYAGTTRFLREYVQRREIDATSNIENGRSALRRWSKALQALGEVLPPWKTECAPLKRHRTVLLEEYAEHMRRYRGSAPKTVAGHRFYVEHLLGFLRNRRRSLRRLRLADIDALLVECRRHWSVRTVADLCVVLRGFVRFRS